MNPAGIDILSELGEGGSTLIIGSPTPDVEKALSIKASKLVIVPLEDIPDEHFNLVFLYGIDDYESMTLVLSAIQANAIVIYDCFLPNLSLAVDNLHLKLIQQWIVKCNMRVYSK